MTRFALRRAAWAVPATLAVLSVSLVAAPGVVLAHEHRHVGPYELVVGWAVEPAFENQKNAVQLRVTKEAPAAIDTENHGAIFLSPDLAPGDTFSYQTLAEQDGLTIPYHSHYWETATGEITVAAGAETSGTVQVEIADGMFVPDSLTVRPGTTIVWTNHEARTHTVTSGPHSAAGHEHADETTTADDTHGHVAPPVPVEGLQDTVQVEVTYVGTGQSVTLPLRAVFNEPGSFQADMFPTQPGDYSFRFFGTIEGVSVNEAFTSGDGTFNPIVAVGGVQFPVALASARELEGVVRSTQDTAQTAEDAASSARTLAIVGIAVGVLGLVAGAGGIAMGRRGS